MNTCEIISCAVCGHTDRLYSCSRCESIFYCSKVHQKKHWKKHKVDCGKIFKDESTMSIVEEKQLQVDKSNIMNTSITPPRTPGSNQSLEDFPSTSKSPISPNFANPSAPLEAELTPPTTPDNEEKCTQGHKSAIKSQKGSITLVHQESEDHNKMPQQGSAETEILATAIERLSFYPSHNNTVSSPRAEQNPEVPINGKNVIPSNPEFGQRSSPAFQYSTPVDEMVNIIIEDLNAHGLCVLDDFCGLQIGKAVLHEVLNIYSQGIFQDGQLVSKSKNDAQSIRSDKILWVDGKEPHCKYIGQVLKKIDALIMRANKTPNNGKLGSYSINGRTKAMCAVYPGSGTHYVKHVDNPNHDGRCITAIYYLNLNWDVKKDGGVLRIYPESEKEKMAEVAPLFDRLIFFWSDRQNPHEVQPAYSTRFAITLWYYDGPERALATKKFNLENMVHRTNMKSLS